MKKIPTLFVRKFYDYDFFDITSEVTKGMEWVLAGEGEATIKYDGACCAFINGVFYKRYDAKKKKDGSYKNPPPGAIPCCPPDPFTGHWPHWLPVDPAKPEDKWFIAAKRGMAYPDGTYEAVGVHFNGNPYDIDYDFLIPHGTCVIDVDRSFEGIRKYLKNNYIEGIVFWKDNEPQCKIKRSDFGFEWPIKEYLFDIH